jgi:hypothetical protein
MCGVATHHRLLGEMLSCEARGIDEYRLYELNLGLLLSLLPTKVF